MKKFYYFISVVIMLMLVYIIYRQFYSPKSYYKPIFAENAAPSIKDSINLADGNFAFPKDHGAHNDFYNEWWYFSGNLSDKDGRKYGYELTFFRIARTFSSRTNNSKYNDDQKYIAHFALTDISDNKFYYKEKLSISPDIDAGANANPIKIWLDDWIINGNYDNNNFTKPDFQIHASTKDYLINLDLNSVKPIIKQGNLGISRKEAEKANFSYYYSLTRLLTKGKIQINGTEYKVSGLSWMDHEWSNSQTGRNDEGWDWYSIQLNNNTEIMFYQYRTSGSGKTNYSEGTLIFENGKYVRLRSEEVKIEPVDHWKSHIDINYPSGWKFSIPNRNIFLILTPCVKNQELELMVNYWEGAVSVIGNYSNKDVSGNGYVELTGYKSETKYLY